MLLTYPCSSFLRTQKSPNISSGFFVLFGAWLRPGRRASPTAFKWAKHVSQGPTFTLLTHGTHVRIEHYQIPEIKKPRQQAVGVLKFRSLAMSYSHMGNPTLPSALFRFTTEFGMGSGGSKTLLSPSKFG